MAIELVMDGYSILHVRHAGGFADADQLRIHREQLLRDLMALNPQPADCMHVVFDGRGERVERDMQFPDFLNVVYSKSGQSADALIESLASRHLEPSTLWIVSNDRAILTHAASQGCRVESAGEFVRSILDRPNAPRRPRPSPQGKRPTLGDLFPPDDV
ncbi:NYN domain-containing protein [Kiritimatiellota bacterium B12222]|nr:NYN domain-containing protein [Kiritimatiellota bacterium B12222]